MILRPTAVDQVEGLIDPRCESQTRANIGVKTASGKGIILTVGTSASPYDGLANSARPLPIARNELDTIVSDAPSRTESACSAILYAPQYAPLVCCPVSELRPHPSYAHHKLSVDASKLSALSERGDVAFRHPIVITRDRIVIDGYARLELAKRKGIPTLNCIERDLTPEEALEELIRTHGSSRGLTDFVRIELALDLEVHFREKARTNQEAGGKEKGSSILTIAQRVDTRREVARVAGVSSGNVRKVKHILTHACSTLLQAVRIREISINLADKWSYEPPARQQEYLRRRRMERGLDKKARNRVAELAARFSPRPQERRVIRFSDLVELSNDTSTIDVEIVDAPGRTIFVTKELVDSLTTRQGVLVL
jgi:hypothetical protein